MFYNYRPDGLSEKGMSKHTQEPWVLFEVGDRVKHFCPASEKEKTSILTVTLEDGTAFGAVYSEDDARRIVACVNACAGLDTEYLESVGLPEFAGKQLCADMVQQELDIVIAQRDVLILRNVQLTQDCWSNLEAFGKAVRQRDQLRAALDRIAATKPKMMHDSNQHEVLVYQPSDNPAAIARAALAATSKS